jgi:hypothetical protein
MPAQIVVRVDLQACCMFWTAGINRRGLAVGCRRDDQAMHVLEAPVVLHQLDRKPIDVINGGPKLRQWVDDDSMGFDHLQQALSEAEDQWREAREPHLIYP